MVFIFSPYFWQFFFAFLFGALMGALWTSVARVPHWLGFID